MKHAFVIIFFTFYFSSAYSQLDSTIYIKYEEKIIENHELKSKFQLLQQNYTDLSISYSNDTAALKNKIKESENEISICKKQVIELNKNKIKNERDSLLITLDSLNNIIYYQAQSINQQKAALSSEKENTKNAFIEGKNIGQNNIIDSIYSLYDSQSFDENINSSTKETVIRDLALLSIDTSYMYTLLNLITYFNALELLTIKYDEEKLKTAEDELSLIDSSKLAKSLKEDMSLYSDYNHALKESINQIINLDNIKLSNMDSEIQKRKFSEIVTILTEYMYDYYNYNNYPYISNILFEILDRKYQNADANISDLIEKL